MPDEYERFAEIKLLGQGQFGRTFLAEDRANDNQLVVIKVPVDKDTELALIQEVINNEILYNNLKQINHPNLVKYLGYDKYKGLFVMIMEYVDGKDLSKVMGPSRQHPPLDVDLSMRIARDVCSGLAAAHGVRLLHSDLKPANILVRDKDGAAKLCDFGVSRVLRSKSAAQFAGTLIYSAPELLGDKASFPADIWSLSVILYEMVTGALPFMWTGNIGSFKAKVEREDPPPPKKLNPMVGDRLNALILRGLQKNPEKRFNAKDMLAALEACLSPQSETSTQPEKSSAITGANRGRQVVGALSALAFAGAAVAYMRKPPVIESITCNPCVMEAGQATTLSWKTTGASKIRIERDLSPSLVTTSSEPAGAFKETPKQRTEYTLVATSRFGVSVSSRKISVIPVDVSFTSTSGYFPMVFWKVSEPTAKVSITMSGLSQTQVLGENLPAQGSRACYLTGSYFLTTTVDGIRFVKSTYVVTQSSLSSVLSLPDGLPSRVKVVGSMLFFESKTQDPPAPASRKYQTSFLVSSSKLVSDPWIFWQLTLSNQSLVKSKFTLVTVWYRKKALLEGYDEVHREKAAEDEAPAPGYSGTYRVGWNGGKEGWLGSGSTLTRRTQDNFRVEVFVGPQKIATGEFMVRRLF